MKRFIYALLPLVALTTQGEAREAWQDHTVNEINREKMHTNYFAYESAESAERGVKELSENFLTLNGKWRFNFVKDATARPTNFYEVGYNDLGWDYMDVPGIWEMNGYGDPLYVNGGYPWKNQFKSDPPNVPTENNFVGSYRKTITIPQSWDKKQIFAHFGAVATNIYLWVNGNFVGYSEDSKLEAEFDLTKYLKVGDNTIAFQVFRWCDGIYLEDQDFFHYTGVARDCYLYAREKSYIKDIRITPSLDEDYINGELAVEMQLVGKGEVELKLMDAKGEVVAQQNVAGSSELSTTLSVENPLKWSAESPNLYRLTATYITKGEVAEVIPQNVGFREIELKNGQILINGEAVLFKGANRHEIDPDGGYYVSRERMEQDILRMKQLNINAVRTSHYPCDNYWYELCDKYGIYVVAEANIESTGMGYEKNSITEDPSYEKAYLERNIRNVERSYNHPSVIFWSLGNESAFGINFEVCYNKVKAEDASRAVQYERARFSDFSDIFCPMYDNYEKNIAYCEDPESSKPLILCEFAHAMGNSMGGFKEYLDLMRKYPIYQGGFIWDFVDQSNRWKNYNGVQIYGYGGDFNRYDISDNNFLNNGVISPDRELNPHADEVKYFYQSIWSEARDLENGVINIYNENFFTDLSAYYLDWEITVDGIVTERGTVSDLSVAPQQSADVKLGYAPLCSAQSGEVLLNLHYRLKKAELMLQAGDCVAKEQLTIEPYKFTTLELNNEKLSNVEVVTPRIKENDRKYLIVEGENFQIDFTRADGFLSYYRVGRDELLEYGSQIKPNFWRAPTDNDLGAKLQKRYREWLNPTYKLNSLKGSVEGGLAQIEACYTIVESGTELTMLYVINNSGAIKVTQKMVANRDKEVSDMFRFGLMLQMPDSYDRLEYYGRGPIENYADRKLSTHIGRYAQSVDEQYYPYIRPQECGTKSDLRWWRVVDISGNGLEFVSDNPFSASALNYTIESLDDGLEKDQRHSSEVEKSPFTNVCVDRVQMGLGCVNSWSALPLEQYQVPYDDYEFNLIIKPITQSFPCR